VTRILVTGSSGFVGRPLVAALAAQGHAVRAVVRRDMTFPDGVETVVVPDLAEQCDYKALVKDIGIVIHLAGIAHTGPQISERDYDRVNRAATAALAAATAAANVERFIFMSSIRAQCGPAAERILTEADDPHPTDAYGRSKLKAEAAVRASGVPFTILRPVLIYGPEVKGNFASLVRIAASPLPLPFGAIKSRRSLLAIDNLVAAVLHVITQPATSGLTYVVADPSPVTLAEIITALRHAAGRSPGLFSIPPRFLELTCRMLGLSELWQRLGGSLVVNPEKLIASGWQPQLDTAMALRKVASSARLASQSDRDE
jgi:UDP-glucose 4-epimerase